MRLTALTLVLLACSGCPVWQSQDVPVPAERRREPVTDATYWQYVPDNYTPERKWPLVITLHGTDKPGYDTHTKQIDAWKRLAQDEGFIVAAPKLRSVQGILPVIRSLWYEDLARDEKTILAVLDDLKRRYAIDERRVLLTGFSSGGFPLYHTGLRNPERFNCLVARSCNCKLDIFEHIELTDAARDLPILVFWGKDDFPKIRDESWAAFRYLRRHGFDQTRMREIRGGHIRRPDLAHDFWKRQPPRED
ncbi:MAG: alpha/beta hydrolase-fold protein [Planctomycetota bacterium]